MLNHSGSVLQVPTVFIISVLILLFLIPVQAVPPTQYYEIDSDVELRGAIFVDVDPSSFYGSLVDGVIQIDSSVNFENVTVRFKGIALGSRLKKYNGFNVGYTHIADNGTRTYEIKPLEIDFQGFAYLTTDFSTVIINGMTGTTTTILTGLSGNQSISVPDGSSYNLNITNNQPGVWTINDTDYSKRVLWTLNITSENLTDYQVERVTPYDSDMQVDMDDRQLTYYENDTLIPFWDEIVINSINATGYVKVPKTSTTEQQQYWMYYNNSSVSSASNGDNVFPDLYNSFESDSDGYSAGVRSTIQSYVGTYSYKMTDSTLVESTPTLALPLVLTNHVYMASQSGQYSYVSDIYLNAVNKWVRVYAGHPTASNWGYYSNGAWANSGIAYSTGQWNKIEYTFKTTTWNVSINGVTIATDVAYTSSSTTNTLDHKGIGTGTGISYLDCEYVRKYTVTEPTWLADGEEQTISGTLNITVLVNGDSNEQIYNTSQSREFTLTPTGTTNNVIINTTSTDYDVTVKTYWTANTTLQTETATAGYAQQYINYTPSFYVTSADLNTTFTFDFSAQDYIGTATSTLNDVSKTTTRNGQNVNASVGSLTESTPYWWNVTVPYNNIFTLSEQSDITAYLGISESFTDSTYNDPEGLPIDSRLWKFGDGGDSSSSNPNHTYVTVGDFNANYSVTETATVSPQAVLREFIVDVGVQPPQNVTTVPHQTNVSIDWDDYAYADKFSVYELEDGFSYVDTNPTIDGVKDAIYDCAHEFLIFSPNPVSPGNYGTIYPVRTSLGAYLLIECVDNDDKLGDDDTIYYFDLDNDGLTVNDPAWKITNNAIKKYLWDGDSWQVTGVSNAVGASTGGGTHYPIHELFIPIAELGANWTNGSTVKVLVKREDSSLSPDVVTWYPYGNINDTDTSLWQEMVLNDPESYILLDNTTNLWYNATGLTPFTIYHGAVSAWNGSVESNYTLFDAITEDLPTYTVSGTVSDTDGNPIANAIVFSCNGFVHEITTTNVSGYWVGYNFREDNYTICANKAGYYGNSIDIFVDSNLTNQNITLTAEPVVIVSKYQKIGEMLFAIPTILKLVLQKIADVIPIIFVLAFIMFIINIIGMVIHAIRVWR